LKSTGWRIGPKSDSPPSSSVGETCRNSGGVATNRGKRVDQYASPVRGVRSKGPAICVIFLRACGAPRANRKKRRRTRVLSRRSTTF
jgi:hypothetical protein